MASGDNWFKSVYRFYLTGFRSMTIGKTLWLIITVKLFIIFIVLKIFFFPDFLRDQPDNESKGNFVGNELVERAGQSQETGQITAN